MHLIAVILSILDIIFSIIFTSSLCVSATLNVNDNAWQNPLSVDRPKRVIDGRCGNGAQLPITTDLHLPILARASTNQEYVVRLFFCISTCVFTCNNIFLWLFSSVISVKRSFVLTSSSPCTPTTNDTTRYAWSDGYILVCTDKECYSSPDVRYMIIR